LAFERNCFCHNGQRRKIAWWVGPEKKETPQVRGSKNRFEIYFFTGCLFPFGIGIKTGCGFLIPNKTDSTSLQFIEYSIEGE
jgi:hypothetical protein